MLMLPLRHCLLTEIPSCGLVRLCWAIRRLRCALKAILIGQGHRVTKGDVWGHDLIGLMKQVQDSGVRLPPELEEDFRVFNSFFNELRYPTALKEVSGHRTRGGFD